MKPICPITGRDLQSRLQAGGKTARSKAINCLREPLWSTFGEKQAESKPEELLAIYTRVSGHAHRANLERLAQSLEDYCAAKGYRVSRVVKEIVSGVIENRARVLGTPPAISALPESWSSIEIGPRALGSAT